MHFSSVCNCQCYGCNPGGIDSNERYLKGKHSGPSFWEPANSAYVNPRSHRKLMRHGYLKAYAYQTVVPHKDGPSHPLRSYLGSWAFLMVGRFGPTQTSSFLEIEAGLNQVFFFLGPSLVYKEDELMRLQKLLLLYILSLSCY